MKCTIVAAALVCSFISTAVLPQTPAAATQSRMLSVRPEPARDPWWQRAAWAPRATVVRGMPIKRIEPAWCAAEAFTRELFGDELLQPGGVSLLDGLSFSVESSLDGSGALQTAFVGAYRRCEGERGLFVAIIDRPGQRPRLRFLVEVPEPGTAFAAVALEPDGTLAVWWCPACENGHRIAFNRETRGFYVAGPATRR
jgi:hypothetical protein